MLATAIMAFCIAALVILFVENALHMVSAVLPFAILFCVYVIAECKEIMSGVIV